MADVWTPETPWFGPDKKTQAVWPRYVCRNPSCPSVGKSHPHCGCGAPSIRSQYKNLEYDAKGGAVGSHFCEQGIPHKEGCQYYLNGGEIEALKEFHDSPAISVDNHIADVGLLHALKKTGNSKSENPEKDTDDFRASVKRGRKLVSNHTENHFNKKYEHPEPKKEDIEALKQHLDELRENPSQLLGLAPNLNLPAHQAVLASRAATAVDYLNSIRPKRFQASPLDEPMPPSAMDSQYYDRHLGIAQSPLSVLGSVRAGTIQPDDLNTLRTIYPHLAQSLSNQTGAALIEAKTNGAEISHKNKMGLSHLLGQPLDATMSPVAMQAIIASAKTPEQGGGKGKKSGATAATQKTIAKADALYQTPDQTRLIDKRTE